MADNRSKEDIAALAAVATAGWTAFPNATPSELLRRLRDDLNTIYRERRAVQQRNGIGDGMEGTCHHLLGGQNSMDELIARLPLDGFIRAFFDGPYILNSFGGFINEGGGSQGYIGAIHRDVRTYSRDFRLMLNMLVMLDDFTIENGATHLLPRSHETAEKPSEQDFLAAAIRATGAAGDILVFDSRLWHAAGSNQSHAPRRALTLTFTRPFFKQQFDYPRYLGAAHGKSLPPRVRQVLGYDSRIPATIEEFYQPPERRAYKRDQG